MEVASLELCKELYELSGWFHPTRDSSLCASYTWIKKKHTTVGYCLSRDEAMKLMLDVGVSKLTYYLPAYSLGYLLRKLAAQDMYVIVKYVDYIKIAMDLPEWRNKFIAFTPWMKQKDYPVADIPEDALCKLAIELFKQGILTKDSQS